MTVGRIMDLSKEELAESATQRVWGFEPKKKEVEKEMSDAVKESAGYPNLEIDSPSDLWDVLGHIKLHLRAETQDAVMENIAAAVKLWETLREEYAEEIKEHKNKPTDSQISFLTQLCHDMDMKVPEGIEDATRAEVAAFINELMEEQKAEKNIFRRKSTTRKRSSRRSMSRRSRRSSRGSDEGITRRQIQLIERLCEEQDMDVPAGMEGWTKDEASEWIQEELGNNSRW